MKVDKLHLTSYATFRAAQLARFLNDAPSKPRQRVLDLMERCRELADLFSRARCTPIRHGVPKDFGPGLDAYHLGDQYSQELIRDINEQLRKYRFRRVVDSFVWVEPGAAPGFPTSVVSCLRPVYVPHMTFSFKKASPVQTSKKLNEGDAVSLLLSVAELGALDRVLQCPQCETWFVAGRKNQDCCSPLCSRKHWYDSNRDKWSDYMRKARLKNKVRDAEQLLWRSGFKSFKSDAKTRWFKNERTGARAALDCQTARITYAKSKGAKHV